MSSRQRPNSANRYALFMPSLALGAVAYLGRGNEANAPGAMLGCVAPSRYPPPELPFFFSGPL